MTDPKKIEHDHGLDVPVEEAIEKFAKMTKEELDEFGRGELALIPEGEIHSVLFKKAEVRKVFHNGEWWFSVVDVIGALTESHRARKYWSDLKRQLADKEGFSELSEYIGQLPLPGADGKSYVTDVATTETLLRIIQSVPSPRAEPFKRWLAKVGFERIQEAQDPEIAIKRAIVTYQLQGRSDDWIEKRVRSIVTRKELCSEWRKRGVTEGMEYAVLTNVISMETFGGVTIKNHGLMKGLGKGHNLRDHMTDLELIFTMLGEKSTTEIARVRDARGFRENKTAAQSGGRVAGKARKQLETKLASASFRRRTF
jgi:DNA-damage-inducible protein D